MVKTFLTITVLSYNGNLWVDHYPMKDMTECKRRLADYNSRPRVSKTSGVCWTYKGDIKNERKG